MRLNTRVIELTTINALPDDEYISKQTLNNMVTLACCVCGTRNWTAGWRVTNQKTKSASVNYLGSPINVSGTMIDYATLGIVCSGECRDILVEEHAGSKYAAVMASERRLYEKWSESCDEDSLNSLNKIDSFVYYLSEYHQDELRRLRQKQYALIREKQAQEKEAKENLPRVSQ